jgi:hypothetical protein
MLVTIDHERTLTGRPWHCFGSRFGITKIRCRHAPGKLENLLRLNTLVKIDQFAAE